jgi:hypothetical protein
MKRKPYKEHQEAHLRDCRKLYRDASILLLGLLDEQCLLRPLLFQLEKDFRADPDTYSEPLQQIEMIRKLLDESGRHFVAGCPRFE